MQKHHWPKNYKHENNEEEKWNILSSELEVALINVTAEPC